MLMLHQSSDKGGMSSMDMVDKVPVPAGGTVKFAPGGYHLMCMRRQVKIGAKVPVLLNLSDGTAVAVAFQVQERRRQVARAGALQLGARAWLLSGLAAGHGAEHQ